MTKQEFEEVDQAFGQLNSAVASALMPADAGFKLVNALNAVKMALQKHLKIDDTTEASK